MKKTRVLALLLALALLCLGFFVYLRSRAASEPLPDIIEAVAETADPTSAPSPTPEPTPPPTPTPTPYVSPIDFESLWAQNEDVFAWLEIPDTTVDFPILQHPTEDEYYLNRNLDKSEGLPGSVFTYSGTAKDFTRFNTIVYAHNLADGGMFGALKAYGDYDYLMAHRTIYIYTPEAKLTYTVFASTIYSDILINAVYDETVMADREAYLLSVVNSPGPETIVPGDTEVSLEDHILTLSTCVDDMPDNRRLVVAKLTEIDPEWRADKY